MRRLLVVVGFLCFAGSVQAELWVEIDDGIDLGEGLYSYTVHLMSDVQDNKATAWDGSFDGLMNQVLVFGALSTPTLTNASYLSDYERARDTHFLPYNADLLTAIVPNESDTHLAGAMGFMPEIATMDFLLAQIVVASGQTVTMTGRVADGSGTPYITQATIIGGEGGFVDPPSVEDEVSVVVDPPTVVDEVSVVVDPPTVADEVSVVVDPPSVEDEDDSVTDPEISEWIPLFPLWVPGDVEIYLGERIIAFPDDYEIIEIGDLDFDLVSIHVAYQCSDVCGTTNIQLNSEFDIVPEPATLGLLAIGAFAVVRRRRR